MAKATAQPEAKPEAKAFTSRTLAKRRRGRGEGIRRQATLQVYRRMRLDPNLRLALALIKAPIYGLKWRIECEDEDAREDLRAIVDRLWRGMVRTALSAVEFGFSPHEKIWALDAEGRPTLEQLNDLQPWLTEVLVDKATARFAGLRYRPAGAFSTVGEVVIPAEKCFVFTHGKEYGSLYGGSRLEAAHEPWDSGGEARRSLNGYLYRKGDPPLKVRAPAETRHNADGTEIDCMEEAENNALALSGGGVAVFPAENDDEGRPLWDAEYMDVPERGDEFLKALDYHDSRAFRACLVPEAVATHGDVGAYAAIKQYTETFLTLEDQLAQDLIEQLDLYVVQPLATYRHSGVTAHLVVEPLVSNLSERYSEFVGELLKNQLTAPMVAEAVDLIEVIDGAGLPVQNDDAPASEGEDGDEPGDGEPVVEARAAARVLTRRADLRDMVFAEAMDDVEDYYEWLLRRAVKKNGRRHRGSTPGLRKPLETRKP